MQHSVLDQMSFVAVGQVLEQRELYEFPVLWETGGQVVDHVPGQFLDQLHEQFGFESQEHFGVFGEQSCEIQELSGSGLAVLDLRNVF